METLTKNKPGGIHIYLPKQPTTLKARQNHISHSKWKNEEWKETHRKQQGFGGDIKQAINQSINQSTAILYCTLRTQAPNTDAYWQTGTKGIKTNMPSAASV